MKKNKNVILILSWRYYNNMSISEKEKEQKTTDNSCDNEITVII